MVVTGKSLEHQRKLKVLRLDNNQITKLDVRELATCVQLTSLDLSNNHIDSLAVSNHGNGCVHLYYYYRLSTLILKLFTCLLHFVLCFSFFLYCGAICCILWPTANYDFD